MSKPILSICIPTFNRDIVLQTALESIVIDPIFLNTDKIEIVISDNCSTDNTQEIGLRFQDMYPDKIRYIRLGEPITGDENFIRVLNEGRGQYLKLNNDRVFYKENSLSIILNLLENNDVGNVLFFLNRVEEYDKPIFKSFYGFDEFMQEVSYNATWIGGLCIESQKYHQILQPNKYSHLHFGQLYIISELLRKKKKSTVLYNQYLNDYTPKKYSRNYNIAKVFGSDFNQLMGVFVQENILLEKTYQKVIRDYLPVLNRVFRYEVKWNIAAFKNYFYYYFPVYGRHFYFYYQFFKIIKKVILRKK